MKRTKLIRKTPLAKQSRKRKAESRIYRSLWNAYMLDHPFCEFPMCHNLAKDIHHKAGRRGKNLIDMKTWAAVCRRCHTWIHDHARLARKLGWPTK